MSRIFWCLIVLPLISASGVLYIDSHTLDFDANVCNVTLNYIHDDTGSSITNVTIQTFKTVAKALLYLNIRGAADKNDREYRIEFVKTVIDLGKFVLGAQNNPLLRGFIESFTRSSDFKLNFPLPPVSNRSSA